MSRHFQFAAAALVCAALTGCPRSETPPTLGDGSTDSVTQTPPNNADDTAAKATPNGGQPGATQDDTDGDNVTGAASPDAPWLAKLGSDDREELKAATDHFAALGEKSLPTFFAHTDDANDDVRRGAHFGLYGRFDPQDSQFVDAMVDALDDSDRGVRHIALEAVNKLPKKAFVELIPKVAPRLNPSNEPDPQLRAQIARMIARQKTSAQDALPALNEAVKSDPDFNVRSACLFAIYNVARNADEALAAPTHVLANDRDPRLRRIAAERLGKYGPAAAPAVPQLVAALADSGVPARAADDPLRGQDEPVCLAAVAALTQIGKPAVEALVKETSSENRVVRVLAIRTLGDIGPEAKSAEAALERAAASNDPAEVAAARTALAKIRGEG